MGIHSTAIGPRTWQALVEANRRSAWAERGVFATGIGPDYVSGSESGLLYVGKSAGPLGVAVGSGDDQIQSAVASTHWMVSRANRSAFWQLADKFDRTRRSIAWTNVCKMDRIGGQAPPNGREWASIAGISMTALAEEIEFLRPRMTLFAISDFCISDVKDLIRRSGFLPAKLPFDDGITRFFSHADGRGVVTTRHPQGWSNENRDRVFSFVDQCLTKSPN